MTVYRYDKYGIWHDEPLEDYTGDDRELSLSRLDRLEKYETRLPSDLVEIPYTFGSDYSGDSVTVSNYRSIWRDFADKIPGMYKIYGGYGTYGLVVKRIVLMPLIGPILETDPASELKEAIDKLEDYPLYDEMDEGAVQIEAQQEALESWATRDYQRELEKLEIIADDDETITDEILVECLQTVASLANIEWIIETGNNAYIDVDRVAENTTLEDIETARENVAYYSREDKTNGR